MFLECIGRLTDTIVLHTEQGNLLIRAYIERYNDPPVANFVSFHGPLAGVGALPQCAPTAFICKEINKVKHTFRGETQVPSFQHILWSCCR